MLIGQENDGTERFEFEVKLYSRKNSGFMYIQKKEKNE